MLTRGSPESRQPLGVAEQILEGVGECSDIVRWHQNAGGPVEHDFGHAGDARPDDSAAGGSSFHRDEWVTFAARRHDDHRGASVLIGNLGGRPRTEEVDVDSQIGGEPLERGTLGTVAY